MSFPSDSSFARKRVQKYSYQLNNQIGKGYSSQVFEGRNDLTNQTVAIKVIDMKIIKGQVHKNLLASEIQVLNTLKNTQNIIDVYDIYTTKNNTYIITQLCDGGDLSNLISDKKLLSQSQAVQFMTQILNGYNQFSSRGIIHRDLKPANIFLKQNQIKIADFGFALKSSDAKNYSSYNVGSPLYMPPEALNHNQYSFKSDIWALGIIFYEMLTGKTPWRAKTEKQLGRQLVSVPIQKLLPKNLSQTSNDFLIRTLNINIDERMTPEQLSQFSFKNQKIDDKIEKSTRHDLGSNYSISDTKSLKLKCNTRSMTSLTHNTINTPKYKGRLNIIKRSEQPNNNKLNQPTTKVILKTQYRIASSNQNIPPSIFSDTQKQISTQKSIKNTTTITDKKLITKQLLCQIHFCRFVYKLIMRIGDKLSIELNQDLLEMKQGLSGLVFNRLRDIQKVKLLSLIQISEFKDTLDHQKIIQIVNQYQTKYSEDLKSIKQIFISYDHLRSTLSKQILNLYKHIDSKAVTQSKQEVIVLDYLITLRQLLYLLQQQNLHNFYAKSKMEQIVQGAPSKHITREHVTAITNKLKSLKML